MKKLLMMWLLNWWFAYKHVAKVKQILLVMMLEDVAWSLPGMGHCWEGFKNLND
jgi:hypothetical protein